MKTQTKLVVSGILTFIAFMFYSNKEWFSSLNVADVIYGILAWLGFFMAFLALAEIDKDKKKNYFGHIAWACYLLGLLVTVINILMILYPKDVYASFGSAYIFFSCIMYFCLAGYLTVAPTEKPIKNVSEISSEAKVP